MNTERTKHNITISADSRRRSSLGLIREFLPHLPRRRKIEFGAVFALMLLGALAELATLGAVLPFVSLMANPDRVYEFPFLQELFRYFGWTKPSSLLLPMTLLFASIIVGAMSIRLVLAWGSNRLVFGLGYDVGVALYERVLYQPYPFHISNHSSEVVAATTKVQIVVNRVLKPAMDGAIALILAVSIVGGLILIDARVSLVAAGVLSGVYFGISRVIQRRLESNSKAIARCQKERIQAIQEGTGGIRDIILDGSQGHFLSVFSRVDAKLRKAQATNSLLGIMPRYLVEGLGMLLLILFAWLTAMTPGGLVAYLPTMGALALGAQRLLPMLQQIYHAWTQVAGNRQLLVDVLNYLDLPIDKTLAHAPRRSAELSPRGATGGLELRGVSFRYGPNSPWVLRDIDLRIPWGARLGIIGKTGSGKSTLMDLMLGLLVAEHGEILVDGRALSRDNLAAWRRKIAHVPQAIYLADLSMAENIAFGVAPDRIDMDRVRRAARQAQLADFIESSPMGYKGMVGERGIQLSGGQRQRLGIARALYKQAEILVLDEATSALDAETESALMSCIDGLDQNLTVIMIAHRLTTLRNCSQLIQLSQGRISRAGSYEEIISAAASRVP